MKAEAKKDQVSDWVMLGNQLVQERARQKGKTQNGKQGGADSIDMNSICITSANRIRFS